MGDHLEDAPGDALRGRSKNSHGDNAHMGHGGIGNELLHVLLRERHQRCVDHCDHRERENERGEVVRSRRKHRQGEAKEPVATHLQENGCKDHRSGGGRFDMGIRQPRVHGPHGQLHGK